MMDKRCKQIAAEQLRRSRSAGPLRSKLRAALEKLLPGKKIAALHYTSEQVDGVIDRMQKTTPKRFSRHKIPNGHIVERVA